MKFKNKPTLFKNSFKNITSITVDILPYHALFIADPFIVYQYGKYHIFCEVFVSQEDKRIVHLESIDTNEWIWVADILTGDDYSFPALYIETILDNEVVIIPQISGTKMIRAYRYFLDTHEIQEAWTIEFVKETRDLIFLENPDARQWFLLCGISHRGRSSLAVSEVEGGLTDEEKPKIHTPQIITKRGLIEGAFGKLIPLKRLTFRPAGNSYCVNGEGFFLPVQATRSGKYGEMIASVEFDWQFKIKKIEYLSPKSLDKGFERIHHISQTHSDAGLFACFDVIPDGGENRWELRVAQIKEGR